MQMLFAWTQSFGVVWINVDWNSLAAKFAFRRPFSFWSKCTILIHNKCCNLAPVYIKHLYAEYCEPERIRKNSTRQLMPKEINGKFGINYLVLRLSLLLHISNDTILIITEIIDNCVTIVQNRVTNIIAVSRDHGSVQKIESLFEI